MTPRCFNRPPYAEGRWHQTGMLRLRPAPVGHFRPYVMKPVLRWHPRWFADRCATHDGAGVGPNGENYPQAHGWDCTGCRWNPETKQ